MAEEHASYYVPPYSKLPFFTALSLFCLGYGSLNLFGGSTFGIIMFMIGAIAVTAILFAWFRETIHETHAGLHDAQMIRSYRWGMFWFIFSDFMLFGIFYMAFFYARFVTIPDLGGVASYNNSFLGHLLLWPNFKAAWPLLVNPNPVAFPGAKGFLDPWGIPALNVVFILISIITLRWAHAALGKGRRGQAVFGLAVTLLLGAAMIAGQILGMMISHTILGIKLDAGIFGSTMFMITGLQLAHVIVGFCMLLVILIRLVKGHFKGSDNFAFDAVAWFWQYLAVLSVLLFLLVYL